MNNVTEVTHSAWPIAPTAKERNAVERSVTELLNELAPERVLKRGERSHQEIEEHRTPTGCVLQGERAAVTVSWFAEARTEATIGELHIIFWNGIVTRSASRPAPAGATIKSELVLFPVEKGGEAWVWNTADGKEYNTTSLAAHCLDLFN